MQGDTVSDGIVNNQVENNTILIKERNVILTNDRWNIVVNVDFSAYQDALAKLKDDLHQINKFKSRFAPTSELSHVNNLVDLLGNQIDSFTQMLPRMDRRRGLVIVVDSVFKTLFGVATVVDLTFSDKDLTDLELNFTKESKDLRYVKEEVGKGKEGKDEADA